MRKCDVGEPIGYPGIDFITGLALSPERVDTGYTFNPGVLTEKNGGIYVDYSTFLSLAAAFGARLCDGACGCAGAPVEAAARADGGAGQGDEGSAGGAGDNDPAVDDGGRRGRGIRRRLGAES